jgi:hypothetical protein
VVAFGAERAFRHLLATQEEIGVAAKNLAAAENHLRVAGERDAARAAARFDVLRAEVQAEEARQEGSGRTASSRGAPMLQALGPATRVSGASSGGFRPARNDELIARPIDSDLICRACRTAAAELARPRGPNVTRPLRLPRITRSSPPSRRLSSHAGRSVRS